MLKNKRILFVILMVFLMILIPNVAKAEKIDLSKIEISVPTPVVGKTPALYDEARVVADGNIELETIGIYWYIWDWDNQQYIPMEATEKFNGLDKYAVSLGYKRSFDYNVLDENGCVIDGLNLIFNGVELDAQDFQVYLPETEGDENYGNDVVWYEFGQANKAKYISKIDVNLTAPEVGKSQYGLDAFNVKADGNETFKIMTVCWEKYNSETEEWEIESKILSNEVESIYGSDSAIAPKEFAEGGKYRVEIFYKRPWEYGYSESLIAKINGETVNLNSFYIPDFNPHLMGTSDYDGAWDSVTKEFSELKKYEPADDKDEESNKDSNLGTEAEKGKEDTKKEEAKKEETKKEDATKAGGTIPYTGGEIVIILSAIAIIGLGIYLYRKNKDLKGI